MQKIAFYIILMVALTNYSYLSAQTQQINWMSWEEAVELSEATPKKIFVDIYTDWCGWCKKMDEHTFTDPNIIRYLNENYYPVRLNAQQKENISFAGKIYQLITQGNNAYHELAITLMNGKMKYPTMVFIDEELQVIQSIPGYRGPLELELFMTYFGEDNHLFQPWFRFKKNQEQARQNSFTPIHSLQVPVKNRN